ncbi:MAG: hypothetical protein ACREJO_09955 [Phycisphaerales bacterium]
MPITIILAACLAACPPGSDTSTARQGGGSRPDIVAAGRRVVDRTAPPVVVAPPTERVYVPGAGFTEMTRIDENDPRFQQYQQQQKRRAVAEQEMKRIRTKNFGDMRKVEIRQAGLAQLEPYYKDPAYYPSLIDIFAREKADVRTGILDSFAEQRTEQGDAAIAWVAVQDKDAAIRDEAVTRLVKRAEANKNEIPLAVKTVIANGLQGKNREAQANAAHVADSLTLIEAIPAMILAQQVGLGGGGGQSGHGSDIAWIMVGRQQAFISDLTPVVGNSAVGFDPTVSVLTEGTVLRIGAAYATLGSGSSSGGINGPLVNMTKRVSGTDTASLGTDTRAWVRWYNSEFLPLMARQQQEKEKAAADSAAKSQQPI